MDERCISDPALAACAEKLGAVLVAAGARVTVAESCTGGWIGKVLTDIPGSSAWFERGFIVYGNRAKSELLGVPAASLEIHGAVSEPVAAAMASSAREAALATFAVAVTGVAGPAGGSEEKPVGMVWLAWARSDGPTECECYRFDGDREAVRRQSVVAALEGLLRRACQ